jgi:hypothetical protein|tara:strand:- start:4392 stop:4796 length:405 start_codon:yes stop_codon:yes gene_type:complete
MKLKVLNFLVLILISSFIISCDNDDDKNNECIEYEIGYVTSLNAPNTGTVNETINIEVNFRVFDGCGGFGKFIETENGNIRTIEVEAKYEGCICTQDAPIRTTNYEFTAINAGEYELSFKSSPTEFITVNLTIN